MGPCDPQPWLARWLAATHHERSGD